MNKPKEVLVLFSGGRDSSATAVLLAKMGYMVRLFTCNAGPHELSGPLGDSAPDIRHRELINAFPQNIHKTRIMVDDSYLIRKLGIEKTNKEHVVYPIVLALAVHTMAVSYCLRNNIKVISTGYSGYQASNEKYIEQSKDCVKSTKDFLKEYNISYLTPIIDETELGVKDILEQCGISSNSLENKTIFGGVPFDVKEVPMFWQSCIPICRKFIKNSMDKTMLE